MGHRDIDHLRAWFASYCRGFYTGNREEDLNYALKERHTGLVCENMRLLCEGLALGEVDRVTAETVALFHDLGRFEQYRRYSTFRDDISTNHAILGVKILKEGDLLNRFPEDEQRTVCRAISLHNVFRLPETMDGRALLFTRLIRDADKLDIWRIFCEFYMQSENERASAVGLGFPDLPECSPDVLGCIERMEMVNLSTLKSLNDFKLLQLSWVFDLNYTPAFRLLQERGYIDGLAETLPKNRDVESTLAIVREYVAGRVEKGE